MIYYRVAFQGEQVHTWKWRSTSVTSLNSLQLLLRTYKAIPQDRILVFFATSRENMDEMLQRQNRGLIATAVSAEQFLEGKSLNTVEVARLELELSDAPDHDEAYVFTMPVTMKEWKAWVNLMLKVRSGELEP
jgi:hypothetical protein